MKQEEWAERLNNHLKDYQQEPTRDLWAGIEASLDKQAQGPVRLIAMRRWLIAAAIMGRTAFFALSIPILPDNLFLPLITNFSIKPPRKQDNVYYGKSR